VPKLFTLKQSAATLSVSVEFLKKLHRVGQLDVVRLGRAIRVPERELERLGLEGSGRGRSYGRAGVGTDDLPLRGRARTDRAAR
jgi:hypothetical protein